MKRILCLLLCLFLALPLCASGEEKSAGREAIDLMINGDTAALFARFTPDMQAAVPEAALAAVWGQITALCGAFEGVLSEESAEASGYTRYTFRLGFDALDAQAVLALDSEGKIAGLNLSPAAKLVTADADALPEGVEEIEITVDAGDRYPLKGTLTLPKNGEKLPAVALVHGSGPSDRDESVGQTKLFRDIAWGLAQSGIAVLRYDKRTYVYGAEIASAPDFADFTVEQETILDAIAAGRLLSENPRVNAANITLCGHSMGALLAPRIVSESNGLYQRMILLSGTPYPLAKLQYDQNLAAIAALTGEPYDLYKAQIDAEWAKYEALPTMMEAEQKAITVFGASGFYQASMKEEPVRYIGELNLPALIVCGGADFQITPENGYDAWIAELKDSAAPVQIENLPALNHLLMRYIGPEALKGTTKEYDTPAHIDEAALQLIQNFILQ